MAAYRIWCRMVEVAPGQHLVTVSAVPVDADEGTEAITSESRLFASAELAHAESRVLCDNMRARVVTQGHHVHSVDFV